MAKIEEIAQAVEKGQAKDVEQLVTGALNEGIDPVSILNDGMMKAMNKVGDKFQKGEAFVPEMLIAARAMKKGMEVLKPKLAGKTNVSKGKCIVGTVYGDLHDIGKNLVALMLESNGYEVIDLGADVPVDKFISTIKQNPDVKLVSLSCLLTTTMPAMKEIAEAIKACEVKGIKVIVGGAPINQGFSDIIGADGYSPDAAGAAQLAKKLVA
jgi:corrinoid protein of di/trimethylamine methyltransferase